MLFTIMTVLVFVSIVHVEIIKNRYPKPIHTLMRSNVFGGMILGAFSFSLIGPLVMSIFQQDDLIYPMFVAGWIYGIFLGRWHAWFMLQFRQDNDEALETLKSGAPHSNNTAADSKAYDDFADDTAAYGFEFDASRFGTKPPPPQQDETTPRGDDKRHPDDAKLWAIVLDPTASDGERRNAMDMILKRQAKRKDHTGRDIIPRT